MTSLDFGRKIGGMKEAFFLFRLLCSILCAAGILFAFSFPDSLDSLFPRETSLNAAGGISLFEWRAFAFMLPWLMMELVCLAGPRRNIVWFVGIFTVLIGGFLLWPLLEIFRPEWLWPTFAYEDGKMSLGMLYLSILALVSLLFRLGLLRYFFPEPLPLYEGNDIELDMLDVTTARSIREISQSPVISKPRFLFGDADHGIVTRFLEMTRRILMVKRLRFTAILIAAGLGLLWFVSLPLLFNSAKQRMSRDKITMLEFVADGKGGLRATHAAVHAAVRVMENVSDHERLMGMSTKAAERFLGLARADARYLKQLRDESNLPLRSAEDIFDSRTRFLTVSDGQRLAILFVRHNEKGDKISVSEFQDEGWNAEVDKLRRSIGRDWRSAPMIRM